jgi:hypothetical protein
MVQIDEWAKTKPERILYPYKVGVNLIFTMFELPTLEQRTLLFTVTSYQAHSILLMLFTLLKPQTVSAGVILPAAKCRKCSWRDFDSLWSASYRTWTIQIANSANQYAARRWKATHGTRYSTAHCKGDEVLAVNVQFTICSPKCSMV